MGLDCKSSKILYLSGFAGKYRQLLLWRITKQKLRYNIKNPLLLYLDNFRRSGGVLFIPTKKLYLKMVFKT